MQIISFLMSVVMAVVSLVSPAAVVQDSKTSTQIEVEETFQKLFPDDGTINKQTYEIFSAIFCNIVVEGISGESESEDLVDLINQVPVYKEGERDTTRMDIKVSPFKKAFSKIASSVLANSSVSDSVKAFLRLVTDGVYDMYVYLMETDEENVYALCYDFVDNSGEIVEIYTRMRINKATGDIYNSDGTGMLGTGFDYNVNTYLVTAPVDVWQRNHGYTIIYDILGELLLMDCNTTRIKFEYGGKDWMVQLWKGDYSFDLLVGGEIGIYNKAKTEPSKYDCASSSEEMEMSMKICRGEEEIVVMDERVHWWLMGLCFHEYVVADELTMYGSIEFKDEEMKNAFLSATENAGVVVTQVNGNRVDFTWQ